MKTFLSNLSSAPLLLLLAVVSPDKTYALTVLQPFSAPSSFFAEHPTQAALVAVGACYTSYSFIVQKVAEEVVKKMMKVPVPNDEELLMKTTMGNEKETETNCFIETSELRKTVSKSMNLVTNPKDRLRWNLWIAKKEKDHTVNANTIELLYSDTSGTTVPTTTTTAYRFLYRSYINFEETAAYHRPFWTLYRFIFTFQEPGKMVISKPCTDRKISDLRTSPVLADVWIRDSFQFFGGLGRTQVFWFGNIVESKSLKLKGGSDDRNCNYEIEWTSTAMKIFLPWDEQGESDESDSRPTKVIENPEIASRKASTPWGIDKLDDGILCLKRGDEGYLVYGAE